MRNEITEQAVGKVQDALFDVEGITSAEALCAMSIVSTSLIKLEHQDSISRLAMAACAVGGFLEMMRDEPEGDDQ